MGKVHIGVTAVGGHKLWGVVGGGRLTVGGGKLRAGHARPLRGGGRVRGCWPGTGRRRGQDPSLRCGRLEGGYGKVRGPGMPGPYGGVVEGAVYFQHSAHVNVENTCNFYLIIIV